MPQIGYLLTNLGTPASTSTSDVRAYLNEFLMDRYVIDVPWLLRRLIVGLTILPFRPKQSATAYKKIWTAQGSPLLLHSQALTDKLAEVLDGPVELAMRYGRPSITDALERLDKQGLDEIVVAPLYPQFADSTVTTTTKMIERMSPRTPVRVLEPFYQAAEFIQPLHGIIQAHIPAQWDHILFSFHGLPERHLTRSDPTQNHCLASATCCSSPSPCHATCYRHQVYATAEALATSLDITADQYSVTFQSRLGRLPWLQPYTDQVLAELPSRGVKHLVVACPAFVADNLETLEEMGIQGRATFLDAGGESFTLVPCLNDDANWVAGLARLLTD